MVSSLCLLTYSIASVGTYIHPSAYAVIDIDLLIEINSKEWPFIEGFLASRATFNTRQIELFWEAAAAELDQRLKAVRILVCGNAGIGKSTLINKTFGLPMVFPCINVDVSNADSYADRNQ